MIFDCHVHDRGGVESYKETPAHALEVARDSGVVLFQSCLIQNLLYLPKI